MSSSTTQPPDPAQRVPPTFRLDAASDAAFLAQLPAIEQYLLANFPGLRGLRQHNPHFSPALGRTTDPLEHTLEVLAGLDTSDLTPAEVQILRLATVFHDIGKLLNPFNVRHAIDSAQISAPYLADFALPPADTAAALALILHHDVLGRVCQGRITADEALELFGTPQIAALTGRLTRADVGAIRGLTHVLPSIEAADRAIQALFVARQFSNRFTPPGELTAEMAALLNHFTPQQQLTLLLDGTSILTAQHAALLEAIPFTNSLTTATTRLQITPQAARAILHDLASRLGFPLLAPNPTDPADQHLTPAAKELSLRWRAFSGGLDAIIASRFAATFAPTTENEAPPR